MLEELRKKSKSTKEAYAFWGAAILTGLVGIIWVVSLPVRFSEVGSVANVEAAVATEGALSQFFSKMKENISNTWQQNKEAIEELSGEEEAPPAQPEVVIGSSTATSSLQTAPPIIIATTSKRSIIIATTSEQTR